MTETTNEQLTGPTGGAAVEVRRNVALAAAVGTLAGLLTLAFAVRAFTGHGGALDWLALGVMVLVTIAYAGTLVDARAPLMIVDDRGVRLRQGARWKGIAWPDIECLEHLPRKAPFRDGHLLVVAHDDRQLVVPLTMATRVVGAPAHRLSDALADLAQGRADVVEVVPGLGDDDLGPDDATSETTFVAPPVAPVIAPLPPEEPLAPTAPPPPAAPSATFEDTTDLSRDTPVTTPEDETGEIEAVEQEVDEEIEDHAEESVAEEPPAPGRTTILAARVDMAGTERPAAAYTPPALDDTDLPTDPTDHHESTVLLEDLAVHPAPIPVIGPQLAVARQRLQLTIDQLSDRTRIRPHVIEAIEVDDFGPCGGDFYARGHLRTLCRVLGVDAGPLVAMYDSTYADAPVDPRRIFESELATGHGGPIRSTRGGRNWSVLISSVMAAVLIWSVAQLVLGGRAPIENVPQLNQSGGIPHGSTAKPVKVVLNAAGGGARLIVRDANGRVALDGPLAYGQTANLSVVPPVRIWSSDGSVTVSIAGKPAKALGSTGEQASGTFVAR